MKEGGRWAGSRLPVSTCIIVEHPEAVSVMVPKELPCYDVVVLLDHLQVLLVEAIPEPRLLPCLLKEPWGHMANYVDLQRRGCRELRDAPSLVSTSVPPPPHLCASACHLENISFSLVP